MTSATIREAAKRLLSGEVVAFPTETVFGLGASGSSDEAVEKIYQLKGRPSYNPLIFHVSSLNMAQKVGDIPAKYIPFLKQFWPGPLTVVLPRNPEAIVAERATAGLNTIAIRMPAHPTAHTLIKTCGIPIVAPSANKSGYVSPTRPEHVSEAFGSSVFILNEGPLPQNGLESTIIDLCAEAPTILRPGTITATELSSWFGQQISFSSTVTAIKAPGQLKKHYAPACSVTLNVTTPNPFHALLDFNQQFTPSTCDLYLDLSPQGHLDEAAFHLYDYMRKLDKLAAEKNVPHINVAPIPLEGIGAAINERLLRASTK